MWTKQKVIIVNIFNIYMQLTDHRIGSFQMRAQSSKKTRYATGVLDW